MSKTATIGNEQIYANNNSLCMADAALNASRLGLSGCAKLNAKTGIDGETVLTDAGLLIAIPEGKQIVVTCFYLHINTLSDVLDVEMGVTANANGTGDFTAYSNKIRIQTGGAVAGLTPALINMCPPMVAPYSATAKAATIRAETGDTDTSASVAFNYWLEDIT
jgi:hypothetical protein